MPLTVMAALSLKSTIVFWLGFALQPEWGESPSVFVAIELLFNQLLVAEAR